MDRFDRWVAETTTRYLRVRQEEDVAPLVAGARNGDAACVSALAARFGPALQHKLSRLGSLAAEWSGEVVNDVFLRLPVALRTYEERGRFDQWLFGLAHNRWRTVRRSQLRDRHEPDAGLEGYAAGALSAPHRVDFELLRARAEAMLSAAEREAWLLATEGFDRQDIARMLEITPENVGVRLDRARKRLRAMLADYLNEHDTNSE